MKRIALLTLAVIMFTSNMGYSFCGFYVAKADVKLFNKTSQVVIAKNGEKQTVTMSSDFEGDVKDFAMVVPVPVVLKREDIRTVHAGLFTKLDDYSAPRLVEYYDEAPCYVPRTYNDYDYPVETDAMTLSMAPVALESAEKLGVTIEAEYKVDEYDILILSAKESGGLETWLNDNGYKMPVGAKEVLDPYIKTNMKFFVCKVNLETYNMQGAVQLNPLQITYSSPKFMLPIRLGMANANGGVQDLIVYMYSKIGRIETTNYRTSLIPTDFKVPLFVQSEFGTFYRDLYKKAWSREGKNTVFLEYAWEVSPTQTQFCDPCVGDPPVVTDLKEAGVDWLELQSTDYHTGARNYAGSVYFTRLHLTYDREHFPQDLVFQETPNKERFQGRYIITHPASGDFSCEKGQTYLKDLSKRRWNELYTYQWLTGREITSHYDYAKEYDQYLKKDNSGTKKQGSIIPFSEFDGPEQTGGNDRNSMLMFFLSMISLAGIVFALSRKRPLPVAIRAEDKNESEK